MQKVARVQLTAELEAALVRRLQSVPFHSANIEPSAPAMQKLPLVQLTPDRKVRKVSGELTMLQLVPLHLSVMVSYRWSASLKYVPVARQKPLLPS
jgi:hypothetical protein